MLVEMCLPSPNIKVQNLESRIKKKQKTETITEN